MPTELMLERQTTLGSRIKAARKHRKMQQNDLANRIGCSSGHLSEIEADKKLPSLDKLKLISEELDITYIGFTVFETVLMNDFLNHLIAQNTIFIQVEKEASAYVFRFLQDEGTGTVMYKPTKKDFNLYWVADTVIVTDMVSEAPTALNNPHVITIEKMLVDMYCDKLIQSTYSKAEYPSVLEQVVKTYKVEMPKMLRYAGRRNRAAEIKKLLEELD